MNPQDPENVVARASQEDPIIMYLIVRESLGMGMGKTAAQCAHASQMLLLKFHKMDSRLNEIQDLDDTFGELLPGEWEEKDLIYPKWSLFNEWLNNSFRKVVLKADEKEWAKLKEDMEDCDIIVVDAGLTEIAPNSETVIGLFPMRKSLVGKLVKRLQVLK